MADLQLEDTAQWPEINDDGILDFDDQHEQIDFNMIEATYNK